MGVGAGAVMMMVGGGLLVSCRGLGWRGMVAWFEIAEGVMGAGRDGMGR